MGLFNNPTGMWFGTEERMTMIDVPETGADVSSLGQAAEATLLNGGGYQRNSWDSHKVYQYAWADSSSKALVSLLQAYRNGSYGRGLLYFHDPLHYDTNLLPKRWADPSMACNYEAEPLIPGVNPTQVLQVGTANNYPLYAASYDVPGGYSSQSNGSELFIPIPPGMTLALGAVYQATSGATIYVRTPAGVTDLAPMGAADATVVNNLVRNQPWARLGIRNTPGASTLAIAGMTARLGDSVPDSEGQPFSYTNILTNPSFEATTAATAVRRNWNTNPRMPNSTVGWATTAAVATLTPTANGTQVDITATTSVPILFQAADLPSPTVGEHWSSSMEITVPSGSPAASVQLRNYAYGVNQVVGASAVVTLQPGTTTTLVANSSTALPSGTTGVRTILYGNGIPAGARIVVRNALAERAIVAGQYIDGGAPLTIRTNIALNPRGANTSGWLSNSGVTNPVTRASAVPVAHPLGITTAVAQRSTGTNSALATMYNVDSLANTGTPERTIGAWVLVNEPGYSAYGVSLPANDWVFVRQPSVVPAGTYGQFYVNKDTGNASTTARAYITGLIAEVGPAPVGESFDGTSPNPGFGLATMWAGTVGDSVSYLYDTDFTTAWSGTVNASFSDLFGNALATYSSGVAASIRSTRWSAEGTYSVRQIPQHVTRGNAYTIIASNTNPRGMDVDKTYTAIFTFYQPAPQGFDTPAARSIVLTGASSLISVAKAEDLAGSQEVRLTFTVPAGTWGLRLYNGGMYGDPDTWWDNGTIVEGVYTGPAFNGRSSGAVWNGAVDLSTSTISGIVPITGPISEGPWHTGEGHSGARFVGDPIVVEYNGVDGGQIGIAATFREVGAWV